jgi:hypothetical protein
MGRDATLDEVALLLGFLIEGMETLAGRIVGDDRGRAAPRPSSAPQNS